LNSTEQLDPQLIWFGLPGFDVDVTVPLPSNRFDFLTESANFCRVNVAVTDLFPVIVTVHVAPDTESHPVQPVKSDPVADVAVRVTTVPTS
jgi:hypothetical protein